MDIPVIEWASAEVKDGTLTVPVAGELPSGLRPAFAQTVRLLGARWETKLKKSGRVRVSGIVEGEEEPVHHLVQAALQQALAAVTGDPPPGDPDGRSGEDEPAPNDADARMTERFRELGGTR